MKNVLLDKGIILPSGEISKDKVNLVTGAITQPFAEMVWVTTGGDMETVNRLTDVLVTMNTPADRGKLFKIIKMLYGLMGLPFSEEAEPMDADPAVLEYFIFSFTADFGEVIQDLIAEEAEYLNEWVESYARVNLRPSTYDGYKRTIANYITPYIGGVALNQLTPAMVDKMFQQIIDKSFFAFTATPKGKTIEKFGTEIGTDADGEPIRMPFHVYSMRQAIEEHYILDVLANYTTIKEAFKLIRVSEDNPELIEGKTSRALFKYYKKHGYTIAQKTDMIMANFVENCRYQINGKGKAMVVADSRANAVRYYLAIKRYIEAHPDECAGCNAMIAFSGEVTLEDYPSDKPFTEATMNLDEKGRYITTDKKFRQAFHSSQYNILVVANKYQTGFDEPLLHTMYVDKKLMDVTAVQTLSRLNRTYPGKNSTFVLDFENSGDDIRNAFLPYYETTILEGSTDLNKVYDLRNKVRNYMLYSYDDVDAFNTFMTAQRGKKHDPAALGKLTAMFRPVIARYQELSEEDRFTARDYVRKFNGAYSYITQLVRLHDKDLFNEYQYTMHLARLLPRPNDDGFVDIEDKVKLEYAKLNETFKGAIALDEKRVILTPSNNIDPKLPNKKKDTLQSIIDKVNERFSGNFTDSDRVIIEGIYQMFMKDSDVKKFKKYAKDNSTEMFVQSLFPDKFRDIVTQCFLDNNDSFAKLFNDPEFYQKVQDAMAAELYTALRKDKE